ncbi:galanin-like G-protein coupled receptor npr-9 [Mercenaria mercenaria]|uniref:galanin-like G-protein coupled receptor npr-9 n=1 Tax=Mercenaria mercenaria TaxID=6596 RepID=UPI00234F48B4|nr:galanin-like G-protein coupled receptor npr-9 [Mercenaria mercenaria]XP_045176873.2 galanin-like G-protein coupled receptor npr-9 [Mercenaria mercenaria]
MSNNTFTGNTSHLYNETEITIFISNEELRIVTVVLAIVCIPLFCLLGSIGNIFSLVVLINQRMRNQTNSILAALCVSDTLFLITCLIYVVLNIYKKTNPIEGEKVRAHVYPIFGAYGSIVTARITSLLTTLLCAERFVAVFFPLQARTICSKRNTWIAIAAIYIVTFLSFVPFLKKYHAVTNYVNENLTFTSMNTTSFYENNLNFYKVYGTILNIIFRFTPLIIIPILNVIMIRVVHKTRRKRRSLSEGNENFLRLSSRNGKHFSSTDQNHITIMLLIVSFVFLICILPGALNSLATHIWCSYNRLGKFRNLYMLISTVTFLLETINSSVNFIIYMVFSRKFKILYKETFCCGRGEYYRKFSLSSVKERFRWSSNKKQNKPDADSMFRRQTVSDIGPLVTDTLLRERDNNHFYEIHSDGFNYKTGTTVMLESCMAYNEKNPEIKNGYFDKGRFDKTYFKNLFRRDKCETSLTIENENGNGVVCKVSACRKNKGLINDTAEI